MDLPTLIGKTIPFPILGMLHGWYFPFSPNLNITLLANSGDPDQTSRYVAWGLGLHYLPISYKRDPMLIWDN